MNTSFFVGNPLMSECKIGEKTLFRRIDHQLLRTTNSLQKPDGFLMIADIVTEMGIRADQKVYFLADAFPGNPAADVLTAGADTEGTGIDFNQLSVLAASTCDGRDVYGVSRVSTVPETVYERIFNYGQQTGRI